MSTRMRAACIYAIGITAGTALAACSTGTNPDVVTGNDVQTPGDARADSGTVNDVPVGTDVPVGNDVPVGTDVPVATDVPVRMDVPVGMDVPPPRDVPVVTDTPTPTDVPTMMGSGVAVTTFQFDTARTGANRSETTLTVAALRAGRLGRDTAFRPTLDGDVYAQPLYLPRVTVAGAPRDLLFVGTQANSLYGLDAATGATVWRTGLGAPVMRATQPCGNLTPSTGIQGTPVIDAATGTIYAVAFTATGTTKTFTINALDVATGVQRAGYPQPIRPPASGASTFDANPTGERSAITLVGGRVYVPFGGLYGDCGLYHGWVVGIDATMPTRQTSWATTGRGSGIWAVGGTSADAAGNLYAATGNGFTSTSQGEYVVRLQSGASGPTLATGTANYFTPSDRLTLDNFDTDIGSMAPVVLPDHVGSSTPHLLFQAGKAGVGYLINRDNLGGQSTGTGTTGEALYSNRVSSGGLFGASATWTNGTNIYVFAPTGGTRAAPCTGTSGVMALRINLTGTTSSFAPAWCSASMPSATPAVSSNGNNDGILWVSGGNSTNLRAYEISTGMEIFTATDVLGTIRKWTPPVIADGRVYVTTSNSVSMYRLVR